MYIARTGNLVQTKNGLEQRFYILDEDDNYRMVKGVQLDFPLGTTQDEIDTQIAQTLKDFYEKDKGPSTHTVAELKIAAVQFIGKEVVKIKDKKE